MNCEKGDILGNCPLCGRPMICGTSVNEHHPVPKSRGGTLKVYMHVVCHHKIHSVFTEKELSDAYSDFSRLKKHPEMRKFIKWVKKQDPEFRERNLTSGRLKEKRQFNRRKRRK